MESIPEVAKILMANPNAALQTVLIIYMLFRVENISGRLRELEGKIKVLCALRGQFIKREVEHGREKRILQEKE